MTPTIERTDLILGDNPIYWDVAEPGTQQGNSLLQKVYDPDHLKTFDREVLFLGEQEEGLSKDEAEFLHQADHPTLPRTHGLFEGIVDGRRVRMIIRNPIEGETLEEKVRRDGPLPPEKAVAYLKQAADVLRYIHEKGFVCRDINPTTMIAQGDRIHVKGLRSLDKAEGIQEQNTESWGYPEEAKAGSVQKDLFSLGTSLYFLITGKKPTLMSHPFKGYVLGEEDVALLEKTVGKKEGAPELARTIQRLISPTRRKRYEHAHEAEHHLEELERCFTQGYVALENPDFRIHRETGFGRVKGGLGEAASAAKDYLADRFSSVGDVLHAFVATPTRIGVLAGLIAAPIAAGVTQGLMYSSIAELPIPKLKEVGEEAPPVVHVSAAIHNIAADVRHLYAWKAGKLEDEPNDVALQKEIREAYVMVKAALDDIDALQTEVNGALKPVAQKIIESGSALKNSYRHEGDDHGSGKTYSGTDHQWMFYPSRATEAMDAILEGIEKMKALQKSSVPLREYIKEGRDNSWAELGIVQDYNAVVNVQTVLNNRSFRELLNDKGEGDGFSHKPKKYPRKRQVENRCHAEESNCDREGAPRGYIFIQDFAEGIAEYRGHLHRLGTIPAIAQHNFRTIAKSLVELDNKLERGEPLDASEFQPALNAALEPYHQMIPEGSIIPAPPAHHRAAPWLALGITFALLTSLGYMADRYSRTRNPWDEKYKMRDIRYKW